MLIADLLCEAPVPNRTCATSLTPWGGWMKYWFLRQAQAPRRGCSKLMVTSLCLSG